MWNVGSTGDRIFTHGHEAYTKAVQCAQICGSFCLDDEDECVDDETEVSCYNCRYRRWTQESFICMKVIMMRHMD